MGKSKTEGQDRHGMTGDKARATTAGQKPVKKAPLDICDSAHDAETYRLQKNDEACDDGIK
jgi:hypothetical protein